MAKTAAQIKAALAAKVSATLGVSVTWTPKDGTYDPGTDAVTGGSAAITGVRVVPSGREVGLVDDSGAEYEQVKLTVPVPPAGLGFTPSQRFSVTYGGSVWQVEQVKPIEYRGDVVAYSVMLVRGASDVAPVGV